MRGIWAGTATAPDVQAGDSLVVLEVESQELCQTGFDEEPELQWKEDREAALRPCAEIKHVFARTARDSPDVTFLALVVNVGDVTAASFGTRVSAS